LAKGHRVVDAARNGGGAGPHREPGDLGGRYQVGVALRSSNGPVSVERGTALATVRASSISEDSALRAQMSGVPYPVPQRDSYHSRGVQVSRVALDDGESDR
jgi:hypothetical protein